MERAKTILDAGYGGLLRLDESAWSVGLTDDDVRSRYVDRRGVLGAVPKGAPVPVFDELRRRLLRRNVRVFLTGQKGAGKSTELRRLLVDAEVAARFEPVKMVVSRWVDQGQAVGMRFVLLSLAGELAEHIAHGGWKRYGAVAHWDQRAEDFVKGRRALLAALGVAEPQGGDFKAHFFEPLRRILDELRGDAARREVLDDGRFAVPLLRNLVVELLALIEQGAGREVLLIVDDGDKLAREELARDVFIDHGEVWLRLPCRAVVTYPYWLHFEPDFRPIALQGDALLLENIKVIRRDAPDAVLPQAVDFFRRLLRGLVDDPAALVDDDALAEAARLGAGVPREFLRVLERGFMRAEQYGEARLSLEVLRYAAQDLRIELVRMTQHEPVRRALVRVRLTQELRTHDDWRLLDQLMVIEHSNDRPWYDVHPLLAGEVDLLVDTYRRRFGEGGERASDARLMERLDEQPK